MRSKFENFIDEARQFWIQVVFNPMITNVDVRLQNLPVYVLARKPANSTKQPRLRQKLLELRLGAHGLIQCSLKREPLLVTQLETGAVSQGLVGRDDARIKQKLAHILVRHARRFLKQLLHGRTGAHIDALRFGMNDCGHGNPFFG